MGCRWFPIQGGPALRWEMIEPHAGQASHNHGQSLERLAERGGLSPYEAVAVLTSQKIGVRGLRYEQHDKAGWLAELQKLIDADLRSRVGGAGGANPRGPV